MGFQYSFPKVECWHLLPSHAHEDRGVPKTPLYEGSLFVTQTRTRLILKKSFSDGGGSDKAGCVHMYDVEDYDGERSQSSRPLWLISDYKMAFIAT